MADENPVPILDFPVISDEGRPADPKPGVIEKVWRFGGEVDGQWQRGERLGEVRIEEPGDRQFVAHFTFDEGTVKYRPVTVTGAVPQEDGRPWVGTGRAKAQSDGREQDVDIEGRNPKKWG
jgi:hypothetical protein